MKRNKKITNEDLARMVQNGFDEMKGRVDKRFDKVESRLDILEQGQEDIKLKLDNVAYRFELEDLEKRVERLELKTGLKRA